VLGGND